MSAIGPGDFLEFVGHPCVARAAPGQPAPHKGRIYQVRELRPRVRSDVDGLVRPGLRLVEPRQFGADGCELSWPLVAFRPIYRPKQSLIDTLKQPAPVDLVEA